MTTRLAPNFKVSFNAPVRCDRSPASPQQLGPSHGSILYLIPPPSPYLKPRHPHSFGKVSLKFSESPAFTTRFVSIQTP